MKTKKTGVFVSALLFCGLQAFSQGVMVNHTCTKISKIPETAITAAKQNLHIAYGHTSHGSQLTEGMNGLIAFMNSKGYPDNLYNWNDGGTDGALDLHDYAMEGDAGYYPDWVNNTRTYLGSPNLITGRGAGANSDVNVIIWSWCGQVGEKYREGKLVSEYLSPMVQLEADYPGIRFVYMTGHLDHWDDEDNKSANQLIRDFCKANNKILYDFSGIESYDPDDNYYPYAGDDCSYYNESGELLGNWAVEWQNSHTRGVDWYDCVSEHSEPLNANLKAYAAWWLWAYLAGWDENTTGIPEEQPLVNVLSVFPNPSNGKFTINVKGDTIHALQIFNATGTELFLIPAINLLCTSEVDLSGYGKGIYFIRIYTADRVQTEKILIMQMPGS